MSDACGSDDIVNYLWRFDDEAPAPMTNGDISGCEPFDVQPTNYDAGDTFPAPAPAGPYQSQLSAFDGEDPNGTWQLHIADDSDFDGGFLIDGWSLEILSTGVFRDGFDEP